jgi:predicted ester cyclase
MEETSMNNSEKIANEYFQAFNSHDIEKERQMLHPQFSYTACDGTRIEGIQAAMELEISYMNAFPDIRLESKNSYSAGDVTITEFLLHGTQKGRFMDIEATNREINFPLCNVLEVRDNKIYSVREYFDTSVLMQQLSKQPKQEPEHA